MLNTNIGLFFAGLLAVVGGALAGWAMLAVTPANGSAPMSWASSLTVRAQVPTPDPLPSPGMVREAPTSPAPPAAAPAPTPAPQTKAPEADEPDTRSTKRGAPSFDIGSIKPYIDDDRAGIRTPFGRFEIRW